MNHRLRTTVIALVLSALLSACATPIAGKPVALPIGSELNPTLSIPCRLPADLLRTSGVDPATENIDYFGVEQRGVRRCGWTGTWFGLTVLTAVWTLDQVKANPGNTGFASVTVSGRDAMSSWEVGDPQHHDCDITFPTYQGVSVVRVRTKSGSDTEQDPCVLATHIANILNPALPK